MKKLLARALALLLTLAVAAPAPAQLLSSLIVTVTSPSQGATVKGTIPVSASVNILGSLTVSRVDFYVDGNFIGSDSTASYSVSWDTRKVGNGWHTLTAVAQDMLGVRWTSSGVSVTVANDITRPTVTINQAAGQSDPTNASPINFTVVFSEPVSGFTGADVAITGTAGGTKTVAVSGGPSTYNAAVSGMTDGTVIATVPAGVAQDAAGNTNTASTSTDNQVLFDATAPAAPSTPDLADASDSGASNTDNLTNDNTPTFIGTAEAGSTVKIFSDGIQVGSGTATSGNYSITTTSALSGGAHSITATATDAAGNVSAPSGALSVTIDTARPTVTINQAATQADPTTAVPINFTVVFSEPVSDFTGSDVAIGGTAGATTAAVSGGPSTYTVAVSGMTGSGTVSATIPAGGASDAAGNTNTASTSTDNSVRFNTTPSAPTITGFSPTSGPVGTDVTITGTNFTGATSVTFNGVPITSGSVVSDTSITAKVPSGATTGPISVTTPGGTATSSTNFTVTTPAPTITSFSPTSGPVGAVVTITGTNFSGATAVTFNTVSAAFLVDSATSIRAEVPAGATTGPIRVSTPAGTATSASNFTVEAAPAPPTITSFTPTSGPVGTTVTISGTNFTGATAVTFNGVSASFTVTSATAIQATVPTGATTGPLSVTTPGGTATSASPFTVEAAPPPPTVTRFEEDSAAVVPSPAGAWVQRGPEIAAFSGGTAGSSDVTGATVTFTFSGTAVTWIGLKCSVCGIATVSIDGGAATSVDTAGAAAPGSPGLVSESVFTASDLAAGTTHTLVITVTGSTTSGGAHIIVDAFDVTGAVSAANRVEENNPAVSVTGAWVLRGAEVATFSGGSAGSSDVSGATATLTFTGTAVNWIGLRCSVCGIATVSLDGGAAGSVNTVGTAAPGSPGLASEAVFSASGLTAGTHTLVITVTGTTTSGGAHIVIDAFDVTP